MTYAIQMMTKEDYNRYMMGNNNCTTKTVTIEATDTETAIVIAKEQYGKDYILNTGYIKVLDTAIAEEKAKVKQTAREAAKQRKIEKDLAKGITPEMRKAITYVKKI